MQCNTGRWSCKLRHALPRVKGCHYSTIHLNPGKMAFLWCSLSIFTSALRKVFKSKTWQSSLFNLTPSTTINGCCECRFGRMHSASFWLYPACGRTCKRVEVWPITKASVSTRHQKFLWTPGSMPKQTIWIKAKCWIHLWYEFAGKLSEMLQRCLNFARQELPLCGTCNYQPCA